MHLGELTIEELETFFRELGEPSYRAKQIFIRIHRHLALSLSEFTEIPKRVLKIFEERQLFSTLQIKNRKIVEALSSDCGTEKFLFESPNPKVSLQRNFESVWIVSEKRRTACVSSQSGCSLNCVFCATGQLPFKGNLETWQILQQVYIMIRMRNPEFPFIRERLTNIVYMGMGEPFYNYDKVIKSAHLLHHSLGLNLGARHITISTAGVVPAIERFIKEKQPFNLAVSLNHPISENRSELMDINKKYPLKDLLKVLKTYVKLYRKNITFEYVLIPEVNMSSDHIRELVRISKFIKHCKFNLIPLNTEFHQWRRPTEEEVLHFQNELRKHGILAFYRGSPGRTIDAACGMLSLKS
ncbi:MAG: radical SAM protein [Leptospiraceae bacterium]|nr:radical SAM protein [Leptospiraceae bacterium]MDW7977003.1 23S rRNA (adenine(2503)-C(2))-methyltransferase RlmN [Leptospiraceae bacterium]